MLIVMKPNSTPQQIENVIQPIKDDGTRRTSLSGSRN